MRNNERSRGKGKVENSKGGTVIGKESTRGLPRNFNDISYFQPFLPLPSRHLVLYFRPFFHTPPPPPPLSLRLFVVIAKVIFHAGTFARLLYLLPNFIYPPLINDVSGPGQGNRKPRCVWSRLAWASNWNIDVRLFLTDLE